MSFPPEAFLIGAEKAGTTMLLHLFDQHPGITVSEPRITDYFTSNWDKGLDWYSACFVGPPESVFLDASRSYSSASLNRAVANAANASPGAGVPARLHSVNPNAKFIYVLRDPVTRTYSSYWQWVREGSEKRPFREAILANPMYFDRSDYCGQLQKYLEYFSLEAFLFVIFEELAQDPIAAARSCIRFIGAVPEDYPLSYDSIKNQGFRFNAAGELLGRLFPDTISYWRFLQAAKRYIPPPLRLVAKRTITKDMSEILPEDRQFVIDHFRAKNDALRVLIGRTLDHWHC